MKIIDQPKSVIYFDVKIPKGTALNDPNNPQLLVSEKIIPHWGVIHSIEMGVERNGIAAYDIHHYSIGVTIDNRGVLFKLQHLDHTTKSVQNNSYRVTATLNFCTLERNKKS